MLGLDASGKTTILYKLKLGDIETTIPTIGFNVETIQYKNLSFTVWDVGGQDKIRPLWRHYCEGVQGLIYVIDSSDRERIDEACEELHRILQEPSFQAFHDNNSSQSNSNVALLIFANKQDLPNSMSVNEIIENLRLHSLLRRRWNIMSTCATSGDGLIEGLDWLSNTLTTQPQNAS